MYLKPQGYQKKNPYRKVELVSGKTADLGL